jgi:hypothetical protein
MCTIIEDPESFIMRQGVLKSILLKSCILLIFVFFIYSETFTGEHLRIMNSLRSDGAIFAGDDPL